MDMLTVDFINVGYGDAILIREENNGIPVFAALVDCGDKDIGDKISPKRIHAADFIAEQGLPRLDLLIVTHLHLDHTGGLDRIAEEIEISDHYGNYIPDKTLCGKTISIPEEASEGAVRLIESAEIYSGALCKLAQHGTKNHVVRNNCDFIIGSTRFSITVAEPSLYKRQQEILDRLFSGDISLQELDELHIFINDTSLCVRIEYANRTFVLTGDIRAEMLSGHSPCTVIKVPHHGHSDSMTPDLAKALQADYAVISVSNDRTDNCPDGEIINMLSDCGAKVLITDQPEGRSYIRFTVNESGRLLLSK